MSPPVPTSGPELDAEIRRRYGHLAAFLAEPEIGPLLRQAAAEGWDEARLEGALYATTWWKTHSTDMRAFWVLRNTDPAQAEEQLQDLADTLTERATRMGFILTNEKAREIGEKALTFAWSEQELGSALEAEFDFDPAAPRGQAAEIGARLRRIAGDYLVPLSDSTLDGWVTQMVRGNEVEENFVEYMKAQAKSLYPGLAASIDAGTSVRQYVAPYAEVYARTLERPADSIDFTQGRWSRAISDIKSGTDGQPMAMSLWEWERYLKAQPEYRATKGASDAVAGFAEKIGQTFGVVA